MSRNESIGGLKNVSLPRISKFVNRLDSPTSYAGNHTVRMGVLNNLNQAVRGLGGFGLEGVF